MEEESILYKDGPKFSENVLQRELSEIECVILTAHVNYLFKNMPDSDETKEEMLAPFCLALAKETDAPKNWLIHSNCLLYRSRN